MVTTDNLVSYYKFDEASGNAADSHGSNVGTTSGITYSATGKINTGFDFATSEVALVNFALNTYTVSMWVKPDVNNVLMYLLDSETGRQVLECTDAGIFRMFAPDINSSAFSTAVYQHVLFTSDGTTVELWLNGVSQGTGGSTVDLGGTIKLGQRFSGGTQLYNGLMDEVAIFNTKISDSDVADLYNSGNGLAYPFSTATLRLIKLAGTFQAKPILTKVGGTFVDKPIKIKVGGTFQDA